MKVAFDVSSMNILSQKRGIGTYANNLFDAIKKNTDIEIELLKEKASLDKFDLVHFPYFDIYKHTLPIKLSKPAVVTIHDLIPLQFVSHYPPGIRGKINWQLQKHTLKNVKSIIAVSNTVKNDIAKLVKIPEEKISVVYSAPSDNFKKISDKNLLKKVAEKYNLPENFVLYVGNINWNKNILNITEAVLKSDKELVIIGSAFLDRTNLNHPEKKNFKTWLEKYSDNRRIMVLGYVENDDLVALMNRASCLIFVSFYEGFGLPILEAQSCGLPVITSKISATAEIAGKSAILVNPENVIEISHAIKTLTNNHKLRDIVIKGGYLNVQKFSWKKTALETVKIYEKILTKQS